MKLRSEIAMSMCHYNLLGVPRTAEVGQIKIAFRKLALVYHPDKNKSPRAAEIFRKILEAYDTLRDTKKREEYDKSLKLSMFLSRITTFFHDPQSYVYFHKKAYGARVVDDSDNCDHLRRNSSTPNHSSVDSETKNEVSVLKMVSSLCLFNLAFTHLLFILIKIFYIE